MPELAAAAISYLFGWVSGLVFLLIDRRPYVRYHAAQSVVIFANAIEAGVREDGASPHAALQKTTSTVCCGWAR